MKGGNLHFFKNKLVKRTRHGDTVSPCPRRLGMIRCIKCGDEYNSARKAIGFDTCLECGEIESREKVYIVVPMHKSNYIPIHDLKDLIGINIKSC